jgi:hypothetical protein
MWIPIQLRKEKSGTFLCCCKVGALPHKEATKILATKYRSICEVCLNMFESLMQFMYDIAECAQ